MSKEYSVENEAEFTIKGDVEKCLDCKFYIWIDSGYGFCRRYPPKWHKRLERRHWWKKPEWEITYQLVEWCRRACGEFVRKAIKRRQ